MELDIIRTVSNIFSIVTILWTYGILLQCSAFNLTQRNNHANISELLDNLLSGYDNSIRPNFGGTRPPAIVEVDIMVRSMGPISEVDMTYSMDCYFRQTWVDKRLEFNGTQAIRTLALSISMLARIWKPDTYFFNGKQSYLHTITTPNKFVRIFQDGRVLYSSRLTIKAGCQMNLEDFPMDIQQCPLKFGSFGYTIADVIYQWTGDRQAVAIADDMKLSQFDLIDCPAGNSTDSLLKTPFDNSKYNSGIKLPSQYSMLMVNFYLQRHMGNFLIQVYGPCCLLVVLSWVSFWLNREATADRVSLGITTVLTMTFLGLEARTDLPKVPYPTALDFFVFLSFAFIFATIIQFAVVHYFTKYGSGECYFSFDEFNSESDSEDEPFSSRSFSEKSTSTKTEDPNIKMFEVIPLSMCSVTAPSVNKVTTESWVDRVCFKRKKSESNVQKQNSIRSNRKRLSFVQTQNSQRSKRRQPRFNSVSKIDRASRVVFPLLFLIINVFYWCAYLSRSTRFSKSTT